MLSRPSVQWFRLKLSGQRVAVFLEFIQPCDAVRDCRDSRAFQMGQRRSDDAQDDELGQSANSLGSDLISLPALLGVLLLLCFCLLQMAPADPGSSLLDRTGRRRRSRQRVQRTTAGEALDCAEKNDSEGTRRKARQPRAWLRRVSRTRACTGAIALL